MTRPTLSSDINTPVSGKTVLAALGLWIALSVTTCVVAWAVIRVFAPGWTSTSIPTLIYVFLVYLSLPLATLIASSGLKRLQDNVAFHYTSRKDLVFSIYVWGLYIILLAAYIYVVSLIQGVPPANALLNFLRKVTDMPRMASADWLAWSLILVRALVLAGLAEEFLFRGLLYGWLRRHFSITTTVLLTSILFAIEHMYPILMPVGFIGGVLTGWVRARTGSTVNTFVTHVLTDGTLLLCACLVVSH